MRVNFSELYYIFFIRLASPSIRLDTIYGFSMFYNWDAFHLTRIIALCSSGPHDGIHGTPRMLTHQRPPSGDAFCAAAATPPLLVYSTPCRVTQSNCVQPKKSAPIRQRLGPPTQSPIWKFAIRFSSFLFDPSPQAVFSRFVILGCCVLSHLCKNRAHDKENAKSQATRSAVGHSL